MEFELGNLVNSSKFLNYIIFKIISKLNCCQCSKLEREIVEF